jgi:hypothetical protein
MSKIILFYFLQCLALIKCNSISSLKVENADYTIACSKLSAQKISNFTVVNYGDMNCFDEQVIVSFDLIDIKTNRSIPAQAYLTQNGCCLVELQLTSTTCKRIRRSIYIIFFLFFIFFLHYFSSFLDTE